MGHFGLALMCLAVLMVMPVVTGGRSTTGRSSLAEMFDALDARWGNVENYLNTVLEVGPTELERLRSHYLE
jgi:hypothetical protein